MDTLNKIFTWTEVQQKNVEIPDKITKTSDDINKRLMDVFWMNAENKKEQYVENQLAKLFWKEKEIKELNKPALSLDNVMGAADDYFLQAAG